MSETKIGKYTILGEIGRGAMGIVYKATDPYIGRTVAIKTIRFDVLGQGPEREMAQKRFMREAHSAGNLSHPHIVTIYDVGEDQGMSYIAMEYIDGTSLEDVISGKKRMSLDEVVALIEKVGDALDTAHRKGVVHRDIKPANILLDAEGCPHLVDFGIARISTSTMTQTNMIMGTPYYMSPEQIAGKRVDSRSDIFALGGVLYELLTGQKPFPGESITTVIYKIMNESPLPMRTHQKNLPEGLEGIVQKALAKDPDARYQNCRALVADLKNYSAMGLAETLVHEAPAEARLQAERQGAVDARRGKKLPLFIAGGVIVAGLAIAALLLFKGEPAPPTSPGNADKEAAETGVSPAEEALLSGQALLKDKKWDEALEALSRISNDAPEHYQAAFLSAEVLYQAGRDSAAEKAFLGLTELRRDDSRVYLRLGQLYDRMNRNEQALRYYQTYLSFLPKGPDAEQALKRLSVLQKEQATAVSAASEQKRKQEAVEVKPQPAVKLPPPPPPPAAKTSSEQAEVKAPVKIEPKPDAKAESPKSKETSAATKTESKKPPVLTEAQRAEVVKLTRDGARAINGKDYDQAVAKLELALTIDPENADARSHLVIARQKKAERDAVAKLKKAKDALWYRRYEEALGETRDVLAFDPRNEEAKKIAGQALQGIQKSGPDQIEDLARQYFQSVSRGDLIGFFQKNGTPTLYQNMKRDMEVISGQFDSLRIAASGGKARVTDFKADETRGTIIRMAGEASFSQTLSGVPKSGGGRRTLFEGSINWILEFREGSWKITDVVSTAKAGK